MNGIDWIASFPKSGNTWVRCMLTTYITGDQVDTFKDLRTSIPDLETMLHSGDLPSVDAEQPVLVKTHLKADVPVMKIFRESTTKVVYLVRNPRDVLLSLMRMMGVPREDVESCRKVAEIFISNEGSAGGGKGVGAWPANVRTWTEIAERFPNADALTIRYEDLRADPVGRFREIVEFLDLGRPVDLDEVRRAVESYTLDRMREVEERGKAQGHQGPRLMGPVAGGGKVLPFVGEGKHGQSLSFMGDDIEDAYRELLNGDTEFAYYAKQYGYAD